MFWILHRPSPLNLIVSALFLVFLGIGSIKASCGSANCPIDTYTIYHPEKGQIRLDLSYEYIDQNQPRIGREKAAVGEISGHHDEISTLNIIRRFGLGFGLTDRLDLGLSLPLIHREHQHIHNHMGTPELSSWNFDGLGDLHALLRADLIKPEGLTGSTLSTIAGLILPTGRDSVQNAEGENAEAGILPSNNAYAFIGGGSFLFRRSVSTFNGLSATMPMFLSSTYQWNQPGNEEYRLGNIWLFNAGTTYPVYPKLGFLAQLNLRIARQDDAGNTNEEVEKTGGSYLYASPGIQLSLTDDLISYAIVQLPVYQRVNEIQLTSRYNLTAGLTYKFSVL